MESRSPQILGSGRTQLQVSDLLISKGLSILTSEEDSKWVIRNPN